MADPDEPRRAVESAASPFHTTSPADQHLPRRDQGRRRAGARAAGRAWPTRLAGARPRRRRARAAARRARARGRARDPEHAARAVLGAAAVARPTSTRAGEQIVGVRRGPGAARLGRQGDRRLLHDLLREPVLEVHRALGGAARAHAEPGHDRCRWWSASRRRRRSRPASGSGYVAGAVLLQAAFTLDCVDGQLARYTRTFSKLGAWLDSIFDRARSTSCSPGWRSARAARATRSGCSRAPR